VDGYGILIDDGSQWSITGHSLFEFMLMGRIYAEGHLATRLNSDDSIHVM